MERLAGAALGGSPRSNPSVSHWPLQRNAHARALAGCRVGCLGPMSLGPQQRDEPREAAVAPMLQCASRRERESGGGAAAHTGGNNKAGTRERGRCDGGTQPQTQHVDEAHDIAPHLIVHGRGVFGLWVGSREACRPASASPAPATGCRPALLPRLGPSNRSPAHAPPRPGPCAHVARTGAFRCLPPPSGLQGNFFQAHPF